MPLNAFKRSALKRKPLKRTKYLIKRKVRAKGKNKRKKAIPETDKPKLWTLKQADKHFSEFIRARDGHCLHPKHTGTYQLQCSHYYGRAIKSTRFDPENCITLCWNCHFNDKRKGFEYQKQTIQEDGYDGQYTLFQREWLGLERFEALCTRAAQKTKQKQAIQEVMHRLSTLTTPQQTNQGVH